MRRLAIYHILILFTVPLWGQEDSLGHYFVDGDHVVFEFSLDDFITENGFAQLSDFPDLNLQELGGRKNSWKKDGWKLKHLSGKTYQLRKHFDHFDAGDWRNKYLIDTRYWTAPISQPLAFSDRDTTFVERVGDTAMSEPTVFSLDDFSNADEVILAGSFNEWNEHDLKLQKTAKGWTTSLDLAPGIYEYKFIIDQNWTHDKSNPLKIRNEHDTYNSVLLIGSDHQFQLSGHQDAKEILLAGSFNNWDERAFAMKKYAGGWKISIPLPPGKHFYKFIIDGKQWILDPENMLQQDDGSGNLNSVLLLR